MEKLNVGNVEVGNYIVITGKKAVKTHRFDVGQIVKVCELLPSFGMSAMSLGGSVRWVVYFTDARKATDEEVAKAEELTVSADMHKEKLENDAVDALSYAVDASNCDEVVEKAATTIFKEGDEIKIIGPSTSGRVEFVGNKTVVLYVCDNGDVRVKEKGYMGDYRPEAVELIHQPTEGVVSECGIEEGDYLIVTGDSTGHMLKEYAVVVAIGINWEDYFEAVELNDDVVWFINYEDVRRPTEEELELIANDVINRAEKALEHSVPIVSFKNKLENHFAIMSELIISKNENYGGSFAKQFEKYGMLSVEMRLNDKMLRLEQLVKGEKDKVGESVEDTLKDIIGYATLALLELESDSNAKGYDK